MFFSVRNRLALAVPVGLALPSWQCVRFLVNILCSSVRKVLEYNINAADCIYL